MKSYIFLYSFFMVSVNFFRVRVCFRVNIRVRVRVSDSNHPYFNHQLLNSSGNEIRILVPEAGSLVSVYCVLTI